MQRFMLIRMVREVKQALKFHMTMAAKQRSKVASAGHGLCKRALFVHEVDLLNSVIIPMSEKG